MLGDDTADAVGASPASGTEVAKMGGGGDGTRVPPSSSVAEFVRLQRAMLGWKQEALASFAAVSLSTVERIERGKSVSVRSLDRVAVALGQRHGAFTEARIPLGVEEARRRFNEAISIFARSTAVPVRPLRGHRQVAALASCHLFLVDAERLVTTCEDDVADLRERLDLTSFLLEAEAEDSILDLGRREPTARRSLYGDVLECVQVIERRGQGIALAGTYEAATGATDGWMVRVGIVAFFAKRSDPGAVRRRLLFAPSQFDVKRLWHDHREAGS